MNSSQVALEEDWVKSRREESSWLRREKRDGDGSDPGGLLAWEEVGEAVEAGVHLTASQGYNTSGAGQV